MTIEQVLKCLSFISLFLRQVRPQGGDDVNPEHPESEPPSLCCRTVQALTLDGLLIVSTSSATWRTPHAPIFNSICL